MKHFFVGRYYAVSRLDLRYREALENIVFFNAEQWRIRAAMLHAIERFGNPRIIARDSSLVLELDGEPQVQTLYVLKEEGSTARLSGVVVFTRKEASLHVIYVGLEPADAHGPGEQDYLFVEIFQLLRGIGRRILGIKFIEFNKGPRQLRLSVGVPGSGSKSTGPTP